MKDVSKKFVLIIYILLTAALLVFALNTFINYLGIRAFKQGDYEKARKHFSNFLVRNKEMIGKTFYKQNRFEEAFDYYQKAENLDGMGLAYLGLKNYEKAIEYFDKTGNNRGKGLALMGQKKYKEALDLFEKAGDSSGLGLAYLAMGDLDKAEEAFRDSSDDFGLGIVLLSKGERVAAIKAFQKSSNETAKGMSHLLRGNLEKARRYFSRRPDLIISGFFNSTIGNYDKAAEIFIYSKDEKRQGQLFMKTGRYSEAYEKLSSISDYENLGELFFRVKDYERAFEYFKKAENYKRAFDSLMARGDIDRAVDFAKEVIQREISYPSLQFSLSEIYRTEGKYDFSIQELDKLGKKKAYRDLSSIYKARTYFASKDYDGTFEQLEELKKVYEDSSWASSLSLSDENVNEISGRKIVSAAVKEKEEKAVLEEQEIEEIEEEEVEEEESGGFPWLAVIIILLVLAGGWLGIKAYLFRSAPTEERQSIIAKKDKKKKKSVEDAVSVAQVLNLEDFRFDGIKILLSILKKQGIKTTREEIIELSGEGEDKLSVYGIYLASRAKGLAVKGIKIDYNYLKEIKTSVIVFFKDETFAHLVNMTEESVSIDLGIDRLITVKQDQFLEIWNEYVMIFGVT